MKHLFNFILENNANEKAEKIVSFIKNSATDDEINKLYDTYIKINGIDSKKDFDMLKNWIEEKMENDKNTSHLKIFQRAVFSACEKYSCYENIIKLAKNQIQNNKEKNSENSFLNINFDKEKIYTKIKFENILNNFNSFDIPEGFFNSLFKTEAAGQPVVGKGEYLLRLISKPCGKNKGGDVIINEMPVEVKNLTKDEANLGNSLKGDSTFIFDFLNEFTDDKIEPQTLSLGTKIQENKKNLIKIKNVIDIISNTEKEKIIKIFKNNINKFYTSGNMKYSYDDIIETTIEELQKLNNVSNFDQFIKIFTSLYTIMYCTEEDAKYLCLIDEYKTFNFIEINNNKQTFKDILDYEEFPFFRIRYSSNKNFVQLKY